jgi:LTXXQ motif family protein
MHFGGAPHSGGGARFGGRPAISRFSARPGFHAQRSFAGHANRFAGHGPVANVNRGARLNGNRNAANLGPNRNTNPRSNAVRNALNSRAVAGALHNKTALQNPATRARIAASAATAGWHDGRGREGWWRHRHGGYGWVGPLFWPFAYYDLYDYSLWGYGYDDPFWDYGYGDIYAGIFSPYGYDDLAGYWPQSGGARQVASRQTAGGQTTTPDQLAQLCGEDSRDIAGLPIDQIQQAIQPNEAQRAALDDLANASVKAAQDIRAACPTQIALTAPARLAAMQRRIEAMISAVETVRTPLQKFYDLLNDEQKVRLNALGEDQHRADAGKTKNRSLAENCGTSQSALPAWPSAEIEARVHPTEAQRASLAALQDATAKATDMLKASCPADEPITPPARLEAAGKRLDVMLKAVKSVRAALGDFYGKLSDEQKAQFEAIGQRHTADSGQSGATQAQIHHRRHHAGFGGLIRHFMSMARW